MNKYMEELTQMLQTGLEKYATSEKYRDLLHVMSLFHNYSANNCLLIALQCPHASYVAGYTSWRNNFHRQVRKGEKAIRIISPVKYKKKNEEDEEEERIGFKSASVFDISSTYQIPDMEPVQIGVSDLQGHIENYKDFLHAFQSVSPVPVDFRLFDGDARGYYSDTEKIIVVQDGMTERQSVKTLIHEIAHAMLHTKEQLQECKKDRKQKELEAESVAYIVCEHYGFDSEDYSFPYIVGWVGTGFQDILKESMTVIQKTADQIIIGVNKYFENNKN